MSSLPSPALLPLRPSGRAEVRRDQGEVPRCASCPSTAARHGPRLYACLSCAAVSCPAHAPDHTTLVPGHEIVLDVDRAELFCAACYDQVYDPNFDAAVVIALTTLSSSRLSPRPPGKRAKRRRVEYRSWALDPNEQVVIGRRLSPLIVQGQRLHHHHYRQLHHHHLHLPLLLRLLDLFFAVGTEGSQQPRQHLLHELGAPG